MTDKMIMMKKVQSADFAIQEAALYLDTHPKNEKAMAYYTACRLMRQKSVDEYQKLFGPLTIFGNESQTEWKWIDGPWPWEMED